MDSSVLCKQCHAAGVFARERDRQTEGHPDRCFTPTATDTIMMTINRSNDVPVLCHGPGLWLCAPCTVSGRRRLRVCFVRGYNSRHLRYAAECREANASLSENRKCTRRRPKTSSGNICRVASTSYHAVIYTCRLTCFLLDQRYTPVRAHYYAAGRVQCTCVGLASVCLSVPRHKLKLTHQEAAPARSTRAADRLYGHKAML